MAIAVISKIYWAATMAAVDAEFQYCDDTKNFNFDILFNSHSKILIKLTIMSDCISFQTNRC